MFVLHLLLDPIIANAIILHQIGRVLPIESQPLISASCTLRYRTCSLFSRVFTQSTNILRCCRRFYLLPVFWGQTPELLFPFKLLFLFFLLFGDENGVMTLEVRFDCCERFQVGRCKARNWIHVVEIEQADAESASNIFKHFCGVHGCLIFN